MFFMFKILLLAIYVPEIYNSIIKREIQDAIQDIQQNEKRELLDGQKNNLTSFTTQKSFVQTIQKDTNTKSQKLKLYDFDKRVSDENPMKRHIHDKDEHFQPPISESTTKHTENRRQNLQKNWPVIDLLSESDESKEMSQYFDVSRKVPSKIFHEMEHELNTEFDHEISNINNISIKNNQLLAKSLGLRSFTYRSTTSTTVPAEHAARMGKHCECAMKSTSHRCSMTTHVCTRDSSVSYSYTMMPFYIPYNVPYNVFDLQNNMAITTVKPFITVSFPMSFAMGIPAGIPTIYPSGIPAAISPGFPAIFQPGIPEAFPPVTSEPILPTISQTYYYRQNSFKEDFSDKEPRESIHNEDLYYDDDSESEEKDYDNTHIPHDAAEETRRKQKQKNDVTIDITYDDEYRGKKVSRLDNSKDLANELLSALKKQCRTESKKLLCANSLVDNCYCSSSPVKKGSRVMLFLMILEYLFLLIYDQ